ncbi:MAG: CHAT domain-containing protein [Planctomycetes bacterium]|nr:CHAT domain-containing protein [Planctomycetota bacterium]
MPTRAERLERALKLSLSAIALCALGAFARASDDYDAEIRVFIAELRAWRGGSDEAAARVDASAARLCDEFARCDVSRVVDFYRALTPAARVQGLMDEERFVALWQRVRDAGTSGIVGDAWREQRIEIERELRTLAADASARPDFVPAAQAWSLCARLGLQRLEQATVADATAFAELLERTLDDAQRAATAFERAGQLTPRIEALWLLGRVAACRGQESAARAQFEQCLRLAAAVRRDDLRESALQGLLSLARAAGDAREQDRRLEELARFREPSTHWPLARDWAARLLEQDFAEESVAFLERNAPPTEAHVLDHVEWELLIGNAQLRRGALDEARLHFERLAEAAPSELAVLSLATLALREERTFEVLALLQDSDAAATFSPLGRERARALLGEALHAIGDDDGAAEHLQAAFDSALEIDRMRALERRDAVAGTAAGIIGERLGLHTVALLADTRARQRRPLDAVCAIEEAQARSLRRSTSPAVPGVTPASVRAWASAYELGLVTWVVGADFTVAAHVAPDGTARCVRVEHGRVDLEEAVRRLRESVLARGAEERLAALALDLARSLFPPQISASLASCARGAPQWPRLLILAHGPCEALPFEVLDWSAIVGTDELALVASPGLDAALPSPSRIEWADLQWTLCGAPLDAAQRELLPGAREELALLRELHGATASATGADFRHVELLQALRSGRALHIATHLSAECDVAGSFGGASLVTSEPQPVCAEEIAAVRSDLPLVVLAACWSGGGAFVDAEGLFGLSRAFLAGGARNLIATQWPIEDSSAAAFGAEFHRALERGLGPARAAALARQRLREAGTRAADFAAFRALGRD